VGGQHPSFWWYSRIDSVFFEIVSVKMEEKKWSDESIEIKEVYNREWNDMMGRNIEWMTQASGRLYLIWASSMPLYLQIVW
jgi:hypothetical protein